MKLQHELSKVLESELGKDLEKEIAEASYLPNESFKTSRQRAIALLQSANDRVVNILTLAIIEHRESVHEEIKDTERAIVETQMSEEDITIGTHSWWRS